MDLDIKKLEKELGIKGGKYSFSVYRSEFLLICAEKIAKLAKESPEDIQCYTSASIVMCAAAVEASVFEYAHKERKEIYYKNGFTYLGIHKKYNKLFKSEIKDDYPDVKKLIDIRNYIVHNEPDHKSGRELKLVHELTYEKAFWAVKTANKFIEQILKDVRPLFYKLKK